MNARNLTDTTLIQFGKPFDRLFERLQGHIRARAYDLYNQRAPEQGDSVKDWLDAQAQLVVPVTVEIKEQQNSIVVYCNLKGTVWREIVVAAADGQLRILGDRYEERKYSGGTDSIESTTSNTYFYLVLELPCQLDIEKAGAAMLKNGKLKLTLPKQRPGGGKKGA
ncbi:MAG: Hsp20/alpha crystallin family protein [Halioglobus sp.]